MKYRLMYRIVREKPTISKGTPGESVPTYTLGLWQEDFECNSFADKIKILERMKELEQEHKENVKYGPRNLPQSVLFFPIQKI